MQIVEILNVQGISGGPHINIYQNIHERTWNVFSMWVGTLKPREERPGILGPGFPALT